MIHIIYKTTHKNGKYYIGRHSTNNLDDGYLGSGKWIKAIKDKSSLTREVIEYGENEENLLVLEGKHLLEHYGKPNCMNRTVDPIGFNSKNNPMKNPKVASKISGDNHWLKKNPIRAIDIKELQTKKYQEGIHNWTNKHPNNDGAVSRRTAEKRHNIFQTNNPSIWRSKQGIHHWQNGKSPNANSKLNKKLIAQGKHNFLGPDLNNKRIAEGTHNFIGSESNLKRLAEGRHPSQIKNTCEHCGKVSSIGMYKRWHGDNCAAKNP
jgi:hypothetical protein